MDHAADSRLAPQIGKKRAHQLLQIDPVGLRAPCATAHLDARRIDLVTDHPLAGQPTMQPVPVQTGLVARQDPNRLAALRSFRPTARQTRCQCRQVASCNRISTHLVRAGPQHAELPRLLAQFKNQINRGMIATGGCVSPIELEHLLDPQGWMVGGTTRPIGSTG